MTLAGNAGSADPAGGPPTGQGGAEPPQRKNRSLLNWRDWGLPAKLAAVTIIPMTMALVLGVTTLSGQVERAEGYERVDRLVALNSQVRTLLDAVQEERDEAVRLQTSDGPASSAELNRRREAVDNAVTPLNRAADRAVEADQRVEARHTDVTRQLDRLGEIRNQASSGQPNPTQTIGDYTAVVGSLLNLDRVVVSRASEGAVGGSANALHNLEVIKEEFSVQKVRVAVGIARGGFTPNEVVELRTSVVRLNDRLGEFRAVASQQLVGDYESTMSGESVNTRDQLLAQALGERGGSAGTAVAGVPEQAWQRSAGAVVGVLDKLSQQVGANLSNISSTQQDDASTGTGLVAVVLFAAFMLAIAAVVLITRQLLRSLRVLRRGALDVADHQLPSAVNALREGQHVSDEVEPVSVHTMDEVGQVARAFDALHRQALRLAIEQTTLRTSYSNVFVNLSRRSQSLVQRQLQLIEQLERDEEDSEQLSTLFQLDHLATRMRRNNENLMVLSGSEPSRRSGQPVAMSDLLRAAVSEIEQYQRVMVQPPPSVLVVGYAGSDLTRLVAELLDNATAFSAPNTKVTVSSRLSDDGSVAVDVLDQGIGMSTEEVNESNARLASAGAVDPLSSRRMGLFVVGRLASRHDIRVQLYGGKGITGVRATVTVPAELVVASPEDQPPQPAVPKPSTGGSPIPSHTLRPSSPDELPRRQRPTNGAARPGALPNLMGGHAAPEPATGPADESSVASGRQPGQQPATGRSDGDAPSGTDLFSPGVGAGDAPAQPSENDSGAGRAPGAAPTTNSTGSADSTSDASGAEAADRAEAPRDARLPSEPPVGPAEQESDEEDVANSSALSDWWASATQERPAAEPEPPEPASTVTESTPIFDEMLSAWFRTAQPEASEGRDPAAAASPGQWSFAADVGRQTVESVSQSAPASFTSAGLPRRVRGEKLMPGTAGSRSADATEAKPPVARRDADEVRGRLSSFQQGVSRGRGQSRHALRPDPTPSESSVFQFDDTLSSPGSPSADTGHAEREPERADADAAAAGWVAPPASEDSPSASGAATPSSRSSADAPAPADAGQQAPAWPAQGEPVGEWPDAHRPEREQAGSARPTGQPAPGAPAQGVQSSGQMSVGLPSRAATPPDSLRASGAQPARSERHQPAHQALEPQGLERQAPDPQYPEPQYPEPQYPEPQYPEPQRPALDSFRPPDEQQAHAGRERSSEAARPAQSPAEGPPPVQDSGPAQAGLTPAQGSAAAQGSRSAEWDFAADSGWQAAEAVSHSAPASFTAAGLPRRVRGEQLLPGSAESSQGGVRTGRDAQDVRGRMSSFQQGLRRGRDDLAQRPGSGNDEENGG